MKVEVVEKKQVKDWLESGDECMIDLAKKYIGNKIPSIEEASKQLSFFGTMGIGNTKMKNKKMNKVYNKRSELYVRGLMKMGYKNRAKPKKKKREPGASVGIRAKRKSDRRKGALSKIISRASLGIYNQLREM